MDVKPKLTGTAGVKIPLVEWNERKGDDISRMIGQYEVEVIKLKRDIYALIQSPDEPFSPNINSMDFEELGPPFHRLL